MTGHVRKQIRNRAADALAQLERYDGRVYQSRVYPLEESSQLPGLLVYTLAEDSEREDSATDSMRDVTLAVQGIEAIVSDELDDILDDIAEEVEKTLDGLDRMDGLVKIYSGIQSTAIQYAADGVAVPHAVIALEFLYTYRTARGAPDVAI